MKITALNTDDTVLVELGERLARTRLERNLSQQQVADAAGVSKRTIERIEAGASVHLAGFVRALRALGLLERLDVLVPEPLPSPIEQAKLHGRQRRRAAPRRAEWEPRPSAWFWGDQRQPPPSGDER
jgi:transcriptional regulator with XRE-family HTH domain